MLGLYMNEAAREFLLQDLCLTSSKKRDIETPHYQSVQQQGIKSISISIKEALVRGCDLLYCGVAQGCLFYNVVLA